MSGVSASIRIVDDSSLDAWKGLDHILAGSPSLNLAINVVGSNVIMMVLLTVVVAAVVLRPVLVERSMSFLAIKVWGSRSSGVWNWCGVFSTESVNLLVHASLSDVMLAVLVMSLVVVSSLVEGRVVGTWVASIAFVWLLSPLPLGEWWKILRSEAVDFLIHASLGDITLMVVLVVMFLGLVLMKA